MSTQTTVITGASDGIGAAAARALSARGDHVVVIGRSPEKTSRIAAELHAPYFVTDFADLDQVRQLAARLNELPTIDVLINNAGAIMPRFERTVDGHERTLQVNHLASFLLTNLLLDTLIHSSATVITTASDAASMGRLDLADLSNSQKFNSKKAYGDSKLENILFARELDARYGQQGVRAASFHPGVVASNFGSDTTTTWRVAYRTPIRHLLTSPEKAIKTLMWLLDNDPDHTWKTGEFYVKCKPKVPNPACLDSKLASDLWERSAELVGLTN